MVVGWHSSQGGYRSHSPLMIGVSGVALAVGRFVGTLPRVGSGPVRLGADCAQFCGVVRSVFGSQRLAFRPHNQSVVGSNPTGPIELSSRGALRL